MPGPESRSTNVEDVKAFYDRFSDSRMSGYRGGGNLRIQHAIGLAHRARRRLRRMLDVLLPFDR